MKQWMRRFFAVLMMLCLLAGCTAWAEKALDFLQPCWWQSHEDHRALQNALLKTHLLAEMK